MEDQDETTEDKLAAELDLGFLARVALAGFALHFAGYAADCRLLATPLQPCSSLAGSGEGATPQRRAKP